MTEHPMEEEHPTDEELRHYANPDDPSLDADRRQYIKAHLEWCEQCQDKVDLWIKGMVQELHHGDDENLCSQNGRCEVMCSQFEDLWKAGQRPRIEDFLDEVPAPEHPA